MDKGTGSSTLSYLIHIYIAERNRVVHNVAFNISGFFICFVFCYLLIFLVFQINQANHQLCRIIPTPQAKNSSDTSEDICNTLAQPFSRSAHGGLK